MQPDFITPTGYESLGLGFAIQCLLLLSVARSVPNIVSFAWLLFPALVTTGLFRSMDMAGSDVLVECIRMTGIGVAMIVWIIVMRIFDRPREREDLQFPRAVVMCVGVATALVANGWTDILSLDIFRWANGVPSTSVHGGMTLAGTLCIAIGVPLVYDASRMNPWWATIALAWFVTEIYCWIMHANVLSRPATDAWVLTDMYHVLARSGSSVLQVAVALLVTRCGQRRGYQRLAMQEKTSSTKANGHRVSGPEIVTPDENFVIEDPEAVASEPPAQGDNPFAAAHATTATV